MDIVSAQSAPLSKAEQQALFARCAPDVGGRTLAAIVSVESSGNPYAVAIVGGPAVAQPSSLPDALALVRKLDAAGANYSAGLMQVNVHNFSRFGLFASSVFDPCRNIAAGAAILSDCYRRAPGLDAQSSLRAALSCYYAGNFKRGFKPEASGNSYVARIERTAVVQTVPDIRVVGDVGGGVTRSSISPVRLAKSAIFVDDHPARLLFR